MTAVLQVFAKAPIPGTVKTRLVPPLDAAAAAALHRALVEHTLVIANSARPAIVDRIELWCAPDAAHPFFAQCAKRFPLTLHSQRGADLGARMHAALADALARGARPVLIGTDCPGLDRAQLAEAFAAVGPGRADIVLLPTEDGGYALIGANRVDRALFDGIAWSTEAVFAQTVDRIAALGWTLHRLATGWDVDRPEDLARLQQHAPALVRRPPPRARARRGPMRRRRARAAASAARKQRVPGQAVIFGLLLPLALATACPAAAAQATLEIGRFSAEAAGSALPAGWKPLTFGSIPRHTRYALVRDDRSGTVVLRADADASASGLVLERSVDLRAFPVIEWRWRAERVLARADVHSRAGDDYPVRLYITFAHDAGSVTLADRAARAIYGQLPPRAAISYIWDTRAPVGTIVPNAYTDRVRMIVVESGGARAGQWLTYRRNLAEDFRKAFGYDPPPVSGIAVMTDTDNTASR